MNVLMVAYTFYECDNRVRRYAETLSRRGDTVEVVALRQNNQPFKDSLNGVTVFHIQRREINERTKLDYLFRVLLFLFNSLFFIGFRHIKKKYDLIHVHSVPDFEVFAAIIPKIFGAKVILDIHDIVPEFYASKFSSGRNSFFSRLLMIIEKMCCSFANHVIISNDIWGERLVKRSIRKEKCTVILNYPDPLLFHRKRPKHETGKFIVMYPGTIAWHQGLDIAVRAMEIVGQKRNDIEFHIYGDGPEKNTVEKFVESLHLSNRVKIFGPAPVEEIVEKLFDTDLGLVPKRGDNFGGEAFSTKILEFMAMGVPALISKTRIDAYYFDDDHVLFFESGNEKDLAEKILLIAENKTLREKLTNNGLRYIQSNNWDVKKKLYLDIIDSLMGLSCDEGDR
jgi:glycosyltransferase involved in cell wall biosynthesis